MQNALFLGKWLLLAFVLESLMVAYVPSDLVTRIAGDGGFLSILGATLVGIPSYLNGNAALPLVAGLIEKGMAPGAAMAFLVGGGVTSIPAALAVFGIARRQVFAAYLALATVGALADGACLSGLRGLARAGLLVDLNGRVESIRPNARHHDDRARLRGASAGPDRRVLLAGAAARNDDALVAHQQ